MLCCNSIVVRLQCGNTAEWRALTRAVPHLQIKDIGCLAFTEGRNFTTSLNMELSGGLSCRWQSEVSSSQYCWGWCSFPQSSSSSSRLTLVSRATFVLIVEGSLSSLVTWTATSVPTLGRSLLVVSFVHIAPAENTHSRITCILTIIIWTEEYRHDYSVLRCSRLIAMYVLLLSPI